MRYSLLALILLGSPALAQPDQSLTPEFAGMSAKERARVARQEQEAASSDSEFRALMAEAEALFQQQRYDEALLGFHAARARRPLNVFPKVKIQDLQALIAKRDAEQAVAPARRPDSLVSIVTPPVPVVPPTPIEGGHPVESGSVESKLEGSTADRKPVALAARTAKAAPEARPMAQEHPLTDGIQESTFLQGRAVVLERRVVRGGHESVYRKVTHPWGQVVHFRDGIAISEREWAEQLIER
ncbi:MAG: hypothetical protein IPM12_13205 [Flavobacteriales bacterium]|nr:hypothetical protein [Flavobacteriales bacterium]